MTTPQSIVVVGRRWFQKTNSNTYHSAEIIVDGERVGQTPITYGYEEQYLWTAFEWLTENEILSQEAWLGGNHPTAFCESIGCKLVYTVTDVGRKSNL